MAASGVAQCKRGGQLSGECQRKLHIKIANNVPLKKWYSYSITHSALPQIRVCILYRHTGACRYTGRVHTSLYTTHTYIYIDTHTLHAYRLTHTSLCRQACFVK